MLYLLRHVETGRDAQADRRKLQRDVIAVLEKRAPGAKVSTGVGRIYVEAAHDIDDVLSELHGLISFSPCVRCALNELSDCVLECASRVFGNTASFALRIKRRGNQAPSSQLLAAELGQKILERMPNLQVDLERPEAFIGVEIHGADCYVFHKIVEGLDQCARAASREGEVRFVADQMLGTLATWLRLLGFDTVELPHVADSALLRRARADGRVLLTRDRPLAQARSACVVFLTSERVEDQLRELSETLKLRFSELHMFKRCTLCNSELEIWPKTAARDRVPAKVYDEHDSFMYCATCDKLYWRGDHHARILAQLQGLID